jgi:hypothetical protein
MSDQLTRALMFGTAGIGIPALLMGLSKKYSDKQTAKSDLIKNTVSGGLAGATGGGILNAVENPAESSNLRQLARLIIGGASGAGLGAAASYAKDHKKLSSVKENSMTYADIVTKLASDLKATQCPGVKLARSDDELKAFVVGITKFASEAELTQTEFDSFSASCIEAMKSIK